MLPPEFPVVEGMLTDGQEVVAHPAGRRQLSASCGVNRSAGEERFRALRIAPPSWHSRPDYQQANEFLIEARHAALSEELP